MDDGWWMTFRGSLNLRFGDHSKDLGVSKNRGVSPKKDGL